jgi:DUF2934 family protein
MASDKDMDTAVQDVPIVAARRRRDRRAAERTILVSTEDIARRAYELYLERGGQDGHDVEDWLRAESEITDQS